MQRNSLPLFLIVISLLTVASFAAAGIVTLNSQTRYVQITTEGAPINLPPETHRQDATDFNPFNATVNTNAFQQSLPGIRQSITQTSSITITQNGASFEDHSTINGSISFNPLPARSLFDVHFILSQSAPFTLSYRGLAGDARFILNSGDIINGSFTGPGAPGLLAPANLNTYNRGDFLTYSGTLQPDSFDIVGDLNANANTGFVDLSLNIGAAPAVPLPLSLWATAATLPLVVLALRRFKPARKTLWP